MDHEDDIKRPGGSSAGRGYEQSEANNQEYQKDI